MATIVVEDYNPEWANAFSNLKAQYLMLLGGLIVDIQHVGSTSVVGLAAKPVIDIDIVIDNKANLPAIIDVLQSVGYQHLGDLGITEREAFKLVDPLHPIWQTETEWMRHNLYVCLQGSEALRNHLTLRDYLRQNPIAAREYGELKTQLAKQFPNDIDAYVEAKTPFILAVLKQCGFEQTALTNIEMVNKKK